MIKKLIQRILLPRHFWRTANFDELSELYVAQLLRSLAISLIGLFTPIYLYTLGYGLAEIALFFIGWFIVRPVIDVGSAVVVAKIGPKHTMLLSSIVHVLYLLMLLSLEKYGWPLVVVAMLGSVAYSLYLLALAVDFSKVKHANHGGKELGYLDIMHKCGGILGPLVGGLIASIYDPRYTIMLAICVLIGSTIPLFLSSEPVLTGQHITFRGMAIRKHWRDYISGLFLSLENAVTLLLWPLYGAIFILGSNTFAKLGIVASISTGLSILVVRRFGALIDNRKGKQLLQLSVIVNALLHLFRVGTTTPIGYGGVSLTNDFVTAGYHMPYMKGVYDRADSLPGYRIAYLASMSAFEAVGRLLLWIILYVAFLHIDEQLVFRVAFVMGAFFSLGILLEKFRHAS